MKAQWSATPVTRIGHRGDTSYASAVVNPPWIGALQYPRHVLKRHAGPPALGSRWKQRLLSAVALMLLHGYLPQSGAAQPAEPPTQAAADDAIAQAERFGAEAFAAYRRGEYTESVSLYLKALELSPSANVLYNVAKIYDLKIRDRELAMSFYRRYIADPGATPDQVRSVNGRLAQLRELEMSANQVAPPSATPRDAAPAPASPPHIPVEPIDDVSSEPRRPKGGLRPLQIAGIIGGSIGVLGLGAGTVFGLAARSKARDADCDGNLCRSRSSFEKMTSAKRAATLSTVTTVAGLGFIATGVLLYFVGDDSAEEKRPLASLHIQPSAGPNFVGSHVTGVW